MGQITEATIAMIRAADARGEHAPLTQWEVVQLAHAWEQLQILEHARVSPVAARVTWLPELPKDWIQVEPGIGRPLWNADQMRDYATAAVLADRAQAVALGARDWRAGMEFAEAICREEQERVRQVGNENHHIAGNCASMIGLSLAATPTASLRQGEAWISCAEKMPPLRVTVLTCALGVDRAVNIGFWTGGSDWQYCDIRAAVRVGQPTHWRSLPAPPIATEVKP